MLRGPWRETTTPHTMQHMLVAMVAAGALIDTIALCLATLSWLAGGGLGTFLFWLAQWTAVMVPLGVMWVIWDERAMLWRHIRARGQRKALQRAEFDI